MRENETKTWKIISRIGANYEENFCGVDKRLGKKLVRVCARKKRERERGEGEKG